MNEHILRDLIRRVVIVAVFIAAIIGGFYMVAKPEKSQINYDIPVTSVILGESSVKLTPDIKVEITPSKITTLEDFTKVVKSLPDGAFKSNLLFVLAADMNGDSIKLNEILQAYGMLLKAQMKKNNTL